MAAFRRALTLVLAGALGLTGTAVLAAEPSPADDEFVPVRTVTRAAWGYADQATPLYGYIHPSGDAPVGAWLQGQPPHHMARSYFTFDLGQFQGKRIVAATVRMRETHANDCGSRDLQLWETGPLTDRLSWVQRPEERRLLGSAGPPESGCLATDARFDIGAAVADAVHGGQQAITLGLRVAEAHEGDPMYGRRFASDPTIEISYNTAPVTPTAQHMPRQYGPDLGCAPSAPGDWFNTDTANDARAPVFGATVTDPDAGDNLTARFAVWSTGDPNQRWELPWPVYGVPAYAQLNEPRLADGQTYAWSVRGEDGTDVSEWGQTCYFTIDRTAPVVPSADSPVYGDGDQWLPRGGVGVPGQFTFTANGSADVTAYEYRFSSGGGDWITVPADGLGGPASITFTPTQSGYQWVSVRSVDRALNRSASGGYAFSVRENRPSVWSDMYPPYGVNPAGGIGVPGVFRFSPGLPDVVGYGYSLNGGPVSTVAADASGRAQVTITPTTGGWQSLMVTNTDRNGMTPPPIEYRFRVDSMPTVRMDPSPVLIGSTATFTFTSRVPGATEFVYWFDGAQPTPPATVPVGPAGTASVQWTPTQTEWVGLWVQTRGPGGMLSELRQYDPYVDDAQPAVTVTGADAPGVPGTLTFRSRMLNVVEYDYWFTWNESDRTTVPAGPDGSATVAWTPQSASGNIVYVVARNAAGVRSGRTSHHIHVRDDPRVQSADYPYGGEVPRTHGSFTFRPRQLGVVEYEYRINEWDLVTRYVPAGPDGSATVSWTATREGQHQLIVRSRNAAGEWSSQMFHYFEVVSTPAVSSAEYPRHGEGGGPGVPGTFTLAPTTFDVVEYEYWFYTPSGLGPVTTVAAGPDGTAGFTWTPDESGWHNLLVRSRSADGYESEWATYGFSVAAPPEPGVSCVPEDAEFGEPRECTFTPNRDGVVSYTYRINDGEETTVAAGADGTARITLTPPGGYSYLTVYSTTSQGVRSPEVWYEFWLPTAPLIGCQGDANLGEPLQCTLTPSNMSSVAEYRYALNGGTETTVPASPDGTAQITVVIDQPGWNYLTVVAVTGSGLESEVSYYQVYLFTSPAVTSEVYPFNAAGGGVGVPGEFVFAPGAMPGVVEYVYRFAGQPEATVPAGPDGRATVTFTPTRSGWTYLTVYSRNADGTESDTTFYQFTVNP